MQSRTYPIGHQDFSKIIQKNFIYIDKTKFALHLVRQAGYYFLSRPRRFGKSLFISTLEAILKGRKELFKRLYIDGKWDFEEYPVIKISFNTLAYENDNLEQTLSDVLGKIAVSYGLGLKQTHLKDRFSELISGLHAKYGRGVAVLIDEYDKPLIDYLNKDQLATALKNRDILKSFYSILKDADPHLQLVFITGVSKFSKVSIFSDLNNLKDLSMDLAYNEICGISQQELEDNFAEELKTVDKEKVKAWYNGYRWDERGATLYNPFSILNFFDQKGRFENFWYATGTPTFLMKICKERKFYEFDTAALTSTEMSSFDLDNLKIMPLLFQTGYLTIMDYNSMFYFYQLGFPNLEVKHSYLHGLLEAYTELKDSSTASIVKGLHDSLRNQDGKLLGEIINHAFSQIPYDLWLKDNEHFYHAIVHLMFSLLGVYIQSEVHTKKGRADALVEFEDGVYCLEFKLDRSAAEALDQIRERAYTEKYHGSGKTIHHIGINFSSEKKMVERVLWEKQSFENV